MDHFGSLPFSNTNCELSLHVYQQQVWALLYEHGQYYIIIQTVKYKEYNNSKNGCSVDVLTSCCPQRHSILRPPLPSADEQAGNWQISKDLPARLKMEAGITLGLTVGDQTDTLTYFLLLGQQTTTTKTETSGSLSVFSCTVTWAPKKRRISDSTLKSSCQN